MEQPEYKGGHVDIAGDVKVLCTDAKFRVIMKDVKDERGRNMFY